MASRFFSRFLLGTLLCVSIAYFGFARLYLLPEVKRNRDETTKALIQDAAFLVQLDALKLPNSIIMAFTDLHSLHVIEFDRKQKIVFDTRPGEDAILKRLDFNAADRLGHAEASAILPGGIGRITSVLQHTTAGYLYVSQTDLNQQRRSTAASHNLILALALGFLAAIAFAISISRRLADRERHLSEAIRTIGENNPGAMLDPNDPIISVLTEPAEKIRRLQAAALDGQQQLYAVFDSMDEPVAVCSEEGVVRRANPAFQQTFRARNPVGKGLLEIIRHPALSSIVGGRSALLTDDNEMDYEGHIYLITRIPLVGRGIQVILFNDVTRVRKLERVRKDFVANASHELRTPLTAIYGYSETLLDTPPGSELTKKFVQMIFDNAKRLTNIFNDLLALSQIESNKIVLEKCWITLNDTMPKILQPLESKMKEKHIAITCDFTAPRIFFDRATFERVVTNLVDNAITYSNKDRTVQIKSTVIPKGVKLSIIDQGIGIDEKHFERIFERFYCVDPSHSKDVGGTGLGLAIVKHLVELNGGEITVTSVNGEGSTFSITAPNPSPGKS